MRPPKSLTSLFARKVLPPKDWHSQIWQMLRWHVVTCLLAASNKNLVVALFWHVPTMLFALSRCWALKINGMSRSWHVLARPFAQHCQRAQALHRHIVRCGCTELYRIFLISKGWHSLQQLCLNMSDSWKLGKDLHNPFAIAFLVLWKEAFLLEVMRFCFSPIQMLMQSHLILSPKSQHLLIRNSNPWRIWTLDRWDDRSLHRRWISWYSLNRGSDCMIVL